MTTLLQSLYQAHLIPAPIASYRTSRLADSKGDGELTLGALDPNYYDASTLVTKANVNKFGYWGVAVDAVKVGKTNMHWSNRTIVVDTGTVCEILSVGDFFIDSVSFLADAYHRPKRRKFSILSRKHFLHC